MGRVLERIASRYFIYRSLYVDYFREHVPERLGWALASEVARLAFTLFAAALCVLIFAALTLGAAQTPVRGLWAVPFGLLALFSLWSAVLTGASLGTAIGASRAYRRELLKK
jgi:hypothetical protein